nr:immunoglobulin heavy chain junction region [Macaca mulatta]
CARGETITMLGVDIKLSGDPDFDYW